VQTRQRQERLADALGLLGGSRLPGTGLGLPAGLDFTAGRGFTVVLGLRLRGRGGADDTEVASAADLDALADRLSAR
jgi:hypothetical protein